MAKRRAKAKRRKNETYLALLLGILIVILMIFGVGYLFRRALFKELEGMKDKMDEYTPHGFTYPTEYEEYVLRYSKEYETDPVLVFSVIKVESNFDPDAESSVGARGLMQLMPEAYDWIKFRLDDQREHSYDDIYDPELNIQYGSYYLSYLMEKYHGSIDLTAAAYHCGMGLVDQWLAEGTISAEDFDVEDIPEENDQTAHYINKINQAYSAYKEILAERNSSETDDELE